MKNYTGSDYALNKYSEGIVYRFADGIVEITLEGYIAENPGKTEQDFQEIKTLSDEIYLEQVRADNRQTKKNIPIHGIEQSHDFCGIPLADEYIESRDREKAIAAYSLILKGGTLTETQTRRFLLHILDGLTYREIAEREGVFFTSVAESITASIRKYKKLFEII